MRSWLWNKGWIVLIPMGVLIYLVWAWPSPLLSPVMTGGRIETPALYLLSSSAQSLAAILALVFTISLIVIQLLSRYSYRVSVQFLGGYTVCYIALFIVAVCTSLWSIMSTSELSFRISFSLTLMCLFFLVPFFLSLRERLSPRGILSSMVKREATILKKNQGVGAQVGGGIQSVIMGALRDKDYDTFTLAVESFAHVWRKSWESWGARGAKESETADIRYISNRLYSIVTIAYEDSLAPIQVVVGLTNATFDSAKEGALTSFSFEIIHILAQFANDGITRKREDVAKLCLNVLQSMTDNYLEHGSEGQVGAVVEDIFGIGFMAAKNDQPEIVETSMNTVNHYLGEAIKRDWGSLPGQIVSHISRIGAEAFPSLPTESASAIRVLAEIGMKAIRSDSDDLRDETMQAIKAIAAVAGYPFVRTTFQEIDESSNGAITEFIAAFEQGDLKQTPTDKEG